MLTQPSHASRAAAGLQQPLVPAAEKRNAADNFRAGAWSNMQGLGSLENLTAGAFGSLEAWKLRCKSLVCT